MKISLSPLCSMKYLLHTEVTREKVGVLVLGYSVAVRSNKSRYYRLLYNSTYL